uniref:Putative rRNA methyltransferase n=1 Tax=Onchocerca volvulus TaxID=6282 RepID=A0A8R1TYH3_ONCVO
MGKKTKIGKQRRDKYYHLAKETGYRSRAAFKLLQINKRFEFLQKSRAVVDLCAAPGGWLQVAIQNMPVSSLCIGVDLVPIKPINRCITLQGDITTEKTRQMVRKELHGWEADCVLHDGAPNVGRNWVQDAFQQNCLTLSALRLATQILAKNGIFVTKVFRSSDYHHLISVFEKLFKQVHVWKPAASRLESAEIFVVCEKYQKPEKLDLDLLDPKKVFAELTQQSIISNPQLLLQPRMKLKKVPAVGYENESVSFHKIINATDFIQSSNYLELLASAYKIALDDERWLMDEVTTDEVKCCLEDIKVCGPRELRLILKWRRSIIKKINEEMAQNEAENTTKDAVALINPEDERMAEIEQQLLTAKAEEKAALKKKKRKLLKDKANHEKRKKLKMLVEGDTYEVPDEQELFSLKKVAKAKDRRNTIMNEISKLENDKNENNSDNEKDSDSDDDNSDSGMDDDAEGFHHEQDPSISKAEKNESLKAEWFSRNEVAELIDDEESALKAVENFMKKFSNASQDSRKDDEANDDQKSNIEASSDEGNDEDSHKLNNKIRIGAGTTSVFIDDNESEEEYHDVDKTDGKNSATNPVHLRNSDKVEKLSPELLALGEQLIYSSKTRRDLEDWGWNRYTNNDEGLPDWFVEDEKKHFRKELPVSKDRVEFYKNRMRDINTRTIKKVAEAKARKKKRRDRKLHLAKKRAEGIIESENMEQAEKAREIRKLYRKTASSIKEKKKITYAVMTKGKRGSLARPKGPYKVVDARLKKDNRRQKQMNKNKGYKAGGRGGRGGRRNRRSG